MASKIRAGTTAGLCSVIAIIAIVLSGGNVRTSERGLALIGNAESCRREPYICPGGILTDGIGNTNKVVIGHRKADAQIAENWSTNIMEAERCVMRYADGDKLPQGAFDAATSITFNAGCPAMQKSTLFLHFRAGNIPAACDQFLRWVYGSGKKLPGLVARRNQERALCLAK